MTGLATHRPVSISAVKPALQAMKQLPALHVAVPLAESHTVPRLPQLEV